MRTLASILSAILCLSLLLTGCQTAETPAGTSATDSVVESSKESSEPARDESSVVSVEEESSEPVSSGESEPSSDATTNTTSTIRTTSPAPTSSKPTSKTTLKATTTTKKNQVDTTTTKKATTATTAAAVNEKYITGISINKKPNKISYTTGDKLDTTGLVINRLYSDGSSDTIKSGFNVMGFSAKKPGKETLTVVYKHENGSTLLCTYDITVTKKQHNTPNVENKFHHELENEVLALVNDARKKAGLNELEMDNTNMMNAADIRAKEIIIDWAHERPDHDRWDTVYDEEDAEYNTRGENLGKCDIPPAGTSAAQMIFDSWMNSQAHRENIMHPAFDHVSIACLEYNGVYYWVQLFGANKK